MTRLRSVLVVLLVAFSFVTPANAIEVVPCGWRCIIYSDDWVECLGEGAYRRRGEMASCEVRYNCMSDATGGSLRCKAYCWGPFCYDV